MADISNEMLIEEALKVHVQVISVERLMSENLALLRQINAELAEGQKKVDAARRRYEERRSVNGGIDG